MIPLDSISSSRNIEDLFIYLHIPRLVNCFRINYLLITKCRNHEKLRNYFNFKFGDSIIAKS